MQKAFPSWAALAEVASSEPVPKKAVHLVAERVPPANGLVCRQRSPPSPSTRHSMGEDRGHDGSESSAYSDHSSAHGDLSSEGEPDGEEWEYGPGFVDRLKSKFISLSLREARRAPVPLRSYASVENLLDSAPRRAGARRPTPAARFKKAQSMEALDPLANDRLVIVEKSPPRRQASSSISDDELPKPDIVRTYKRIFEASVDNRRPNSVRRRPSVGRGTQPGSPKRARALASRLPGRVPANKENQPRTPTIRKPIANIKPLPKEPPPPPPPAVIAELPAKEETVKLAPLIASDEPVLRPSALLRTAGASSLWSSKAGTGGSSVVSPTSVVFDFRGKNVKPHVAVLPAPVGCCKKGEPMDEVDLSEEQLPYPSGIVFVGENVRIGRGALLTTRNKKLKIQFNDSAVVRIEYPAEEESPETPPLNGPESPRSPEFPRSTETHRVTPQAPGLPSGSGSLGSYTPSAVSTSDSFQLGLSRATPSASTTLENGIEEDASPSEDQPEELTPADPTLSSGWSSSADTSDLLF